ncbi:GNAT family N-acetyltransferase [Paraburkholderia sp. BCC1885]|uniref:GNAT family N-acetyltransferase n=1 Tax=Paraburkholderia sp. BCC1885 TaxID=2562669 RepID=UPI001182C774|nr:GNAT family N-acetyltransferase [Paraburkholderia sp. BCC1885]
MSLILSEIDRARFGVVTAKATARDTDELDQVFGGCEEQHVEFLILRVGAADIAVVQEAEKRGAFITDTLLYFKKTLASRPTVVLPVSVQLRVATAVDAPRVAGLAVQIFKRYDGHYQADCRLPTDKADQVYSSWAEASCVNPDVADTVLILERGDEVIGFSALKITAPQVFDCCLLGVSPSARREGLFSSLLQASEQWGASRGLTTMGYSTQITNVPAQRGLCKAGFLPSKSSYTLHKWFV